MPGRKYTGPSTGSGGYRYGFNGKENDNEISEGDLDFGARIYNSRLGRWLSLDPLQAKYPGLSPYNFVANSPLKYIDPDGKEIVIYYNGQSYIYKPGVKPVDNAPTIVKKFYEAAQYIMQTKTGKEVINTLVNSDKVFSIVFQDATAQDYANSKDGTNRFLPKVEGRKDGDIELGVLRWDYNSMFVTEEGWLGPEGKGLQNGYFSPSTVLLHELGHAYIMNAALQKGVNSNEWKKYLEETNEDVGYDSQYDTKEERQNTTKIEDVYIKEINDLEKSKNGENASYQHPRKNHAGQTDFKNNNADVNTVPSRAEQKKKFNSSKNNSSN